MKSRVRSLLVFVRFATWLLSWNYAIAQQPSAEQQTVRYIRPKGYLCFRSSTAADAIVIDGKLDEPAWGSAPWTDYFVDIEGDLKPLPRFRTRAKMLWDDCFFYVAAELDEPHLQGTFTKHDSYIFHDDNDFEVFIDPDGDGQNYAEYEMNALNTGWDLRLTKPYKNGGKAEDHWEIPGLKTSVHLYGTVNQTDDIDRGWTLELAFPWKALSELAENRDVDPNEAKPPSGLTSQPTSPRDGEQWRVNFSRVEWRYDIENGKYRRVSGSKEDNWVWSPQWTINMHRPETWGYVQFSSAVAGTPETASVKFRPDPAGPAKFLLHRIQYAQTDFRKLHSRWATTLTELELHDATHSSLRSSPIIQVSGDQFQASVEVKISDQVTETWMIREDAKIWKKP